MKITGLDGRQYVWKFPDQVVQGGDRACSALHARARTFLRNLYPLATIHEEIYLPGANGLYADFYVPVCRSIIEAHGRQHYEYVAHFHGKKSEFRKAVARDAKKREWCDLNNISYVELPHSEDESQWLVRLTT